MSSYHHIIMSSHNVYTATELRQSSVAIFAQGALQLAALQLAAFSEFFEFDGGGPNGGDEDK